MVNASQHHSRWEKWLFIFLCAVTLLVCISASFRFPTPFNYDEYAPDNHWFDVTLRSTYLRWNNLPGAAVPLSSDAINGHDYVYTSVNNFSQLFYSAILKVIDLMADFRNVFNFLIYSRLLMLIINIFTIYAVYRLLLTVYPSIKTTIRWISLLIFTSWPILHYFDCPRWFPLVILLSALSMIWLVKLQKQYCIKDALICAAWLLLLALTHFYGMFFAVILALFGFFSLRHCPKKIIALLVLAAFIGSLASFAPIYIYSEKYKRMDSRETGAGSIVYYFKTWPKMWIAITRASFGLTAFHINLHGTIPNMLSDITNTILPTPPVELDKIREALGFKWSRWSTTHGDNAWYAWQLPLFGFIGQTFSLFLFFVIFAGYQILKKINALRPSNLKAHWKNLPPDINLLYFFTASSFVLYLILFFRFECEPYARYGISVMPLAIILAELAYRNPGGRFLALSRSIYLTIFVFSSLYFLVQSEFLLPITRPDYEAYRRLIAWAGAQTKDRALYFDFSDYYYLPAKLLIDAPMPFGEYAFPNIKSTRDFQEVYGTAKTMIVGISADIPAEEDNRLLNLFQLGHSIRLAEIPTRGGGIYYMPARPKDGRVLIEYFERIELADKNRFVYFFAGEIAVSEP